MRRPRTRFRSASSAFVICASLFVFIVARDARSATQSISGGFHRTSYWKELVEFSDEPGSPESAIGVLISDLHDPNRLVQPRGPQSVVGTAVIVSSCHALTNRHLAFEQPNRSRAELRNAAPTTRLLILAGRGAEGRPLVKTAHPIQFGDPGGEGLFNIRRDWALLELDDCFRDGEIQPAALLAATRAVYASLRGKLKCAAFPIDHMSFDAVARGQHKLAGTTGASIIGELDIGGYLHNCGSKPGFSGMPIYTVVEGRMLVIALNVGTLRNQPDYSRPMDVWDPEYANTAVPVSEFITAIHALVLERLKVKRIQAAW